MGRLRAARTERWGKSAALLVASMYVIWCHSLGFSFVYIVKLSLYFFFWVFSSLLASSVVAFGPVGGATKRVATELVAPPARSNRHRRRSLRRDVVRGIRGCFH